MSTDITKRLLALAALVIIAAGMHASASYLQQILLAAFIAIITQPMIDHLRRRGWPMMVILSATGLFLAGLLIIMGTLATQGIQSLINQAPTYQAQLLKHINEGVSWFQQRGVPIPEGIVDDSLTIISFGAALKFSLSTTTELLRQSFAIILLVIFMWVEAPSLPQRLQAHIKPETWFRLSRNVLDLRRYMALKAGMSLLTGIVVGTFCWLIDIPFAGFMGIAAFILNFVPVVGSILAAIPALVIALVDHGAFTMLMTGVGYAIINVGISNGLEPRVLGRGLGLSPLAVVLSLFIWGWILGPAGMLLSVPMTMAIRAMIKGATGCEALVAFLGNGEPDQATMMWRKQQVRS